MQYYFIAFLEGIITFVSPCLLPMLPIYISYFAGGDEEKGKNTTIINALGFVLGFSIVFTVMGSFAGTIGSFLREYQTAVNIISGAIVILFGLNFLNVFKLNIFNGNSFNFDTNNLKFLSSVTFGMVFSIGWTPCVGAFLGSALMMASQKGTVFSGMIMLLCYSLGLGIPFILSAVLIDKLKNAFSFIKRNYKVINSVSGVFLIIVGISMMTGTMGKILNFLSVNG